MNIEFTEHTFRLPTVCKPTGSVCNKEEWSVDWITRKGKEKGSYKPICTNSAIGSVDEMDLCMEHLVEYLFSCALYDVKDCVFEEMVEQLDIEDNYDIEEISNFVNYTSETMSTIVSDELRTENTLRKTLIATIKKQSQ